MCLKHMETIYEGTQKQNDAGICSKELFGVAEYTKGGMSDVYTELQSLKFQQNDFLINCNQQNKTQTGEACYIVANETLGLGKE